MTTASDPSPSHRIAILDDDIQFIRLVERLLRQEHIVVEPVTTLDVEEAARVIGAKACDLAMVDIFMYGAAAGFELIELLRAQPETARLPILVTSGARREIGKRLPFLREHDCAVLLKPFDPDDLMARMQDARTLAALAPLERPAPATPGSLISQPQARTA